MASVLIIEDEEIISTLLEKSLAKKGFIVTRAINGKEGIQAFENGLFDIVISDLCMPKVDGNGVAKHIRQSDRCSTPIIGISGTPWLFNKSAFNEVIPKPFLLGNLTNSVNKFVASTFNPQLFKHDIYNTN